MTKATHVLMVLLAVWLLLPACGDDDKTAVDGGMDGGTDSDTDTDTDSDSDTDTDSDSDTDTDSDSDGDVGEDCGINFMGYMDIPGICGETVEDCSGGVMEGAEQGDCMDGLVCCLDEDECETGDWSVMLAVSCEADECVAGMGFHAGCPDGQWCCIQTGDNDGGDAGLDEDCVVSLIPDMIQLNGACQADESACEGGYITDAESGNCQEGLDCCIDTDQCALLPYSMFACQSDECITSFGFQAGCPDNEWCCSVFK